MSNFETEINNPTKEGLFRVDGSHSGTKPSGGADWIVENFMQWDGDKRWVQRWTNGKNPHQILTRWKEKTNRWSDWKDVGMTEHQVNTAIQSKADEVKRELNPKIDRKADTQWVRDSYLEKNRFYLHPQTDSGASAQANGMFKIPIGNRGGDFIIYWTEINLNFGSGGNNGIVRLPLHDIVSEVYSVQLTPVKNLQGNAWNFPVFQYELTAPNSRTVEVRCNHGGTNRFQLLAIGRKW